MAIAVAETIAAQPSKDKPAKANTPARRMIPTPLLAVNSD